MKEEREGREREGRKKEESFLLYFIGSGTQGKLIYK